MQFLVICFIFLFLFPHETGGVCKCASAIWTLSCVGFFFLGRVAGITRTWTRSSDWTSVCGHGELMIHHGGKGGKSRMGFVCGVQGCKTLEGREGETCTPG